MSELRHQGYQNLPKLDSPAVDPNGNLSIPWYRFFITLWQRTGGQGLPTGSMGIVQTTTSNSTVAVYSVQGNLVGYIGTGTSPPTPSTSTGLTAIGAPVDVLNRSNLINAAESLQHPPDTLNSANLVNTALHVMPVLKGP